MVSYVHGVKILAEAGPPTGLSSRRADHLRGKSGKLSIERYLCGEVPAVRETMETRYPFCRVWPDPRIESSIHKKLLHRPLGRPECSSGCRRV